MIKTLRPQVGKIFVYTIMLSVFASIGIGQSNVRGLGSERQRIDRIMTTGANIEEFRQEYLNYLTELRDAMRIFASVPAVQKRIDRSGFKPIPMLEASIASVGEMSPDDLAKVRAVYAQFPGWREVSQSMIKAQLRQEIQTKVTAKISGASSAVTGTKLADNCADGISAGTTNTDISAARGAQIALAALMEAFPTDGITIAARLPSIAANAAGEVATLTLETLKGIKDDCEAGIFEDSVTTSLDAIPGLISDSTSTTATNITTAQTAIIANDDANKTTIVNNDNTNTANILTAIEAAKTYIITDAHANKDEMKNLLLRTQIEADLASTDGSTFVALYETPGNICKDSLTDKGLPQIVTLPGMSPVTIQQCGLLDLVRIIVKDSIANVGAGTNAQSFFNTAEAHRTAGKFKLAYASYRMAYKAASK
jgi:hypothetical protein